MDPTAVRLRDLALTACTGCQGEIHQPHKPANYRITGMLAYSMVRRDLAVAWFDLTRGSTVVRIDGQEHRVWWFLARDAADEKFRSESRTIHLSNTT